MTETIKMFTTLVPRKSVRRECSVTKKVITVRLKRWQNKTKRKVLDRINLKVVRDENVVTQHLS